MFIEVIGRSELSDFTHTNLTLAKALLLGGDRLSVCDEAIALKDDNGNIMGVASIAPQDEEHNGVRTIVGLYVVLEARQGRLGVHVGYEVFEAAVRRCLERGFERIYVDVLSTYALRIIQKLPEDLRSHLDLNTAGLGFMDMYAEFP